MMHGFVKKFLCEANAIAVSYKKYNQLMQIGVENKNEQKV